VLIDLTAKVVIGGNHDRLLDAKFMYKHPERISEGPESAQADLNWYDIMYQENSTAEPSFPTRSAIDDVKHELAWHRHKQVTDTGKNISLARAKQMVPF
jgi:hypothetical protein